MVLIRLIILNAFIVSLLGCVSVKPPEVEKNELDIFLFATDDINQDILGLPSPVRVTFLQLATVVEFNQMTELATTSNYKAHLGESVLDEINVTLHPSSKVDFKLPLKPDADYLGVVIAYRDLSNNWKLSLFKQEKQWYQKGGNFMYLEVKANGVEQLTKKEAYLKIANAELKEKGKDIKELTEKEKDKIIKEMDKALAVKKKADLEKGLFIQPAEKAVVAGE